MSFVLSVTLAVTASLAIAESKGPADFSQFAIEAKRFHKTKRLNMKVAFARRYKTLLAKELKLGPNFAGRFRIAQIGCGPGCSRIAVVSCQTGYAYNPKLTIEQATEDLTRLGERIEFRKDSSLVILRGCINESADRCGTSRYAWKGNHFDLVSFYPPK